MLKRHKKLGKLECEYEKTSKLINVLEVVDDDQDKKALKEIKSKNWMMRDEAAL